MAIWLRNVRRESNGLEPGGFHATADGVGDATSAAIGARVGARSDVLRASDYGALVALDAGYQQLERDRAAILAAAREEAARLVAAGGAEAAALVDAAREEREHAQVEGYRQGERQAVADWMARTAENGDARAQMYTRMRERLATVVSVAVEKIVTVEERDLLFERALAEVDRIADGAAYLHVTVHPDDLAAARGAFDRLATRWRELGQAFPVTVRADRRVERGNCVAESDFGAIDASLATQLRGMRSAVARALQRAALESEHARGREQAKLHDEAHAQAAVDAAQRASAYGAEDDAGFDAGHDIDLAAAHLRSGAAARVHADDLDAATANAFAAYDAAWTGDL